METIAWIDNGKNGTNGSEILTLMTLGPCRFLIPKGMALKVAINESCPWPIFGYEVVEIADINDIWLNVKPGYINVISYFPYILDPVIFSNVLSDMFKQLIRNAHDKKLPVPLSVFIDEFHIYSPSGGHGLGSKHYEISSVIQMNIEQLRGWGVRLVATIQGNTKLRKGVRQEFGWLVLKSGANFNRNDEPKLSRYTSLFVGLDPLQLVVVWPGHLDFSDPIRIDYYPKGHDIGDIDYIGLFERPTHE